MKIKTKLQLVIIFTVIVFTAIIYTNLIWHEQADKLNEQQELTRELNFGIFQRSQIRDEYFIYREERSKEQWSVLHKEVGELLEEMLLKFKGTDEKTLLGSMKTYHIILGNLFEQLVKHDMDSDKNEHGSSALRERIINQMLSSAHSQYLGGMKLTSLVSKKSEFQHDRSHLFSNAAFGALALLIVSFAVIILRSITYPLTKLHKGTETIADGDLDYKTNITSNDEIGGLAKAFDTMTEKLKIITVSRNELSREIEERKRVEEKVRREKLFSESIMNSLPGVFYLFDDKGKFLRWNKNFELITEYSGEEISAMSPLDFFTGEEKDLIQERIKEVFVKGISNAEVHFVSKSGRRMPYYFTGLHIVLDNKPYLIGVGIDIAERKKAEAELRESESRFKTLVENIPQKIFVKNKDYKWVSINENLARDLGIRPEEVVGKVDEDFFPKELSDKYHADDKLVMDTGQTKEMEEQYVQDGKIVWVNTIKTPIRNDNGNITGVFGIFWDITERKLAEEALRDSEARYRSYIDATGQIAWVTNAAGEVVEDIPAFRKFTGQTYEEVRGTGWAAALHPDDFDRTIQVWNNALAEKGPYETEYRVRRRDGVYRHLLARGFPVLRDDGSILEWVGTCIDLTERMQTEEMLIESEERFRSAFEQAAVGIAHVAPNGSWMRVNKRLLDIVGYTEEELMKLTFQDITHPEDLETDLGYVQKMLNGELETYSMEKRYIRKDRSIVWINLTVSLVRDEHKQPKYFVSVIQDISDKKKTEADMLRYAEDLERSNRELEQFAYVASHDLQEPLRMISSYTQLLSERYEGQLDDKAKKYIEYAVDGAVRMQRLINDLLSYSRVGTRGTPMEPTDCHSVLGEVIRNLAAMIEENRAIITNDELPTVRADASQLVQLFQNLISNAIKFKSKALPHIHISARDDGREWCFMVKDNGIGIDSQYAEKVFVIFQRLHTRQEYPGTGIGLSVCKKIVERHGGRIWFESELGKGSTFFFTIKK